MNHKNLFFALCIAALTYCSATAQTLAMGDVKNAEATYSLRSFSSELMPASYGSEDAPVAVLYLKDAQQRVCANFYFYASENVMQHQQASRDRETGLVEDHYNLEFYEIILELLKDRALQHSLVYDLDTDKVILESKPRSAGVSRELKSPKKIGTK